MGSCGSATEVVNKGKFTNPKLNMYGDKVAVKYHDGKAVPYNKWCEATGVLRKASVYNEGVNLATRVFR